MNYDIICEKICLGGSWLVAKPKKNAVPENCTATQFLRGQASRIFDNVTKEDTVVIVNKNSKPQNVIISYERYKRLKENGADI